MGAGKFSLTLASDQRTGGPPGCAALTVGDCGDRTRLHDIQQARVIDRPLYVLWLHPALLQA